MVYNQFKSLAFVAIFALFFSKALGTPDVNQEIQSLKTTVSQLKNVILNHNDKLVELYSHLKQHEITISVLQNDLQHKHAATTSGSVYIRWGRKDCPSNGTGIVYTGMGAGGHYANIGRNANPLCIPHDPEVGNKNTEAAYGAVTDRARAV
ncbi:uncharacterized protein LOC134717611 [Mytilus trossulus]|uniref:uncharacterized protein LOC134717611 n=1 Tax=Mytilus trossulus TaxID=6551 RepID=UPI003006540E